MTTDLPASWSAALSGEMDKPYFPLLSRFVDAERAAYQVFPPEADVFNALKLTPLNQVRALILGQDPYHDGGQAHGLAFSVRPGIAPPPSLKNIFKELHDELGIGAPQSGFLEPWATQGVLLLNTVLTVRAHEAGSHQKKGWETFTDAVIKAVSAKDEPVVFVLWGKPAQKKLPLIDVARHTVIQSAHPSPLSARTGFFGSRPFSQINALLAANGQPPINWQL